MSIQLLRHELRTRLPAMATLGVAAEHFPNYGVPDDSPRFHTHDVLYASLLVQGRARHDIGDVTLDEGPGTLAVVLPGVAHRITTGGERVEVFNLYLDQDFHALPVLPAALRGPLHRLLPLHPGFSHTRNRLRCLTLPDPAPLVAVLHDIIDEQRQQALGQAFMLHALAARMLTLIARALVDAGVHGPADAEPVIEQAEAWLAEHLDEEIHVDALAHAVGYSVHHLCRRFRAYTGLTPMDYLWRLRLHEAAVRLRSGEEPVLAIAMACGFKDLGHFGRRFKSAFGLSPLAYRAGSAAH